MDPISPVTNTFITGTQGRLVSVTKEEPSPQRFSNITIALFKKMFSEGLLAGCNGPSSPTVNLNAGLEPTLTPGEPRIIDMPDQQMLTVPIHGDPNTETKKLMGPLYGAIHKMKWGSYRKEMGRSFNIESLRARWSANNMSLPKDQWTGTYGLPVPNDLLTTHLPDQSGNEVKVGLTTWKYGKVAQILHVGPYTEEGPAIEKLRSFVRGQGYEFVPDTHEEVYVKLPPSWWQFWEDPQPRTIILYRIRSKN